MATDRLEQSSIGFDGPTLARLLGTTERHVRRLVAERRIPFVRVGRFIRFEPNAIARWLEGGRSATSWTAAPTAIPARFGEWAERWWHTVRASDRAANTKVQYETILRRHVLPAVTGGTELFTPGLGDRRLVRLQRIDLEEWLAALSVAGRGASTIRTARTIAGMVLESAARSGVIRANPLLGVRVTRRAGSNARKALTPEQVEQLAEMVGVGRPGYRELVLLLGYGGLRPNEAFALRRRDLGA